MRAEDLDTLVSVGRPTVAPDASFAVFATSRADVAANRAVGQLWRIELPDGGLRRLTRGTADTSPRVSPDGARIAFVRSDGAGKAQIFLIDARGGEAVQVTDAALGVSEYVWSPDGEHLAYTARVPEPGRYGTVEGLAAIAEPPRRITGVRWHANSLGYIADRPSHIFLAPVPSTEAEPFYEPAPAVLADGESAAKKTIVATTATQLTTGTSSYSALAFVGSEIYAVRDDIEQDRRDLRSLLVAVRAEGGEQREVVTPAAGLAIDAVEVASDGVVALLAYEVGETGTDFIAPGTGLWILDGAEHRRLTDAETIDLGEVGSHITPSGDDFLVQHRSRGRVRLLRVSRDGALTEVLGGDIEVSGHAAAGNRIVAAVATPTSAGELVLLEDERPRTLTAFGAGAAASGIVTPRELTVAGRDGYAVHGWVATPEGAGPFPVILQIHGGPYASYGIHLFDETQVLVDAGYAVVYCNPRGSAGYGRAHGRSIRHAMGTLDHADVIDFLEGAIAADPRLDGERTGIMGGSYGGYLTAWIIAHDHRFAGAIVERGFLDPTSFQGTSDIGSFFGDEYVGTSEGDIARQSPLAVVARVETPTLVVHSELDYRCPLEQATRYYSALKRNGTPAEMLIFPGEDHELTRSGQPRHRLERFRAVLAWWRQHLPTD